MSDELNPQSETETETPETPAAPTPQYASQAAVDALVASTAHLQGGMNTILQALGQTLQHQQAPVPQAPEFNEEQLAEMMESGEGKQIVRAQRFIAAQENARLRAYVDEQQQATLAIGQELTQRLVKNDMPLYGQDPEIARDVDALMGQMHPAARANPKAFELCYRQVLADPKHFDRVVARKVEEEIRRRATDAAGLVSDPTTGASSRAPVRKPGEKVIPSAAEILGPENAHALAQIGKDENSFARELGYKDWTDFIEKTESYDPTSMTR